MYKSFVSLGRYTPKYFILFVAMVNGSVSLISLSVFSLLVYRNARDFCVLHETSARTWCTGKTQRDRVEREVGGGIGMGNTCNSMADSCQCMTKTTTIL